MHLPKRSSIIKFLIVIGVLGGLNVLFLQFSPQAIVGAVGVSNTYLVAFLIACFGGLNSLTSGVLYGSIATFAAGGATPWLLGITAGIGIAIGDALIFRLLQYGLTDFRERWQERLLWWTEHIRKWPMWVQYLVVYLVLGFSPMPNDIIMLVLIILGFRFREVLPLLLAGGITIATVTAYLGEGWLAAWWG